ncbi:hypothetical protein GCM10007036_28690 [Alsobacter metallidurans]|uniref:Uncharacterized protein n=1 Tax=Alsobacter metallidurans TaxID=340221 RepID=A0A917MIW7_9HYPH|nr:hypothetical protein [Alsobacter metallidurans]GGH23146.1 hypothetical protein GCM10007036_28690 [Alsobacter metallidurans]
MTLLSRRACLAGALGGVAGAALHRSPAVAAAASDDLAVRVTNLSEPVLCAEKDNIDLRFASPDVRSCRIQAVHPAFIGSIVADRWAPDFTSCDMSNDPSFTAKARRVTFFESTEFWLTGYAYPSFWRPADVPFRVGDRVEHGLHVVQLWMLHQERAEEILVIYPPDGYWRARPLPPAHMRWSAYGSSFLVGPVEVQERPIVALREISFDPASRTFTIAFAGGGSATLRLTAIDPDRQILDVGFDRSMPGQAPFAALRSMYATEYNCDVARTAWRAPGAKGWGESPILDWKGADATELWAGRLVASRHNTSAPDMVFSHFSKGPPVAAKP